ncbi:MAG: beta-galactosidase trimerization domain-containing protein [Terriglobia bacterium]|jgi:beta-galactosidase GanA
MKRFLAGFMISLMISAAGALAGQRPYEVGTVYIFLPSTSNEQIVRDLETIAATGINTIEICPSFLLTPGNPQPDFSKTDLILKTSERLGLRVMPTVFWSGLLPDYAEAKWPDRFSPIIDGEGREARLSYANPEVMRLIDDYSIITVQHFKDSPSVIAYNIWDEPHMEGFSLSAGERRGGGGDPHFDRWFEEWGLKKYGSPSAWYLQWNDPLLNQEYAGFDRPLFYWYATGHILQHLNELVKSIDPVHPTRTHDVGSTVVSGGVNIYRQDDWTMSKFVDEYGLSYYPDIPARGAEDNPEQLAKEKALWDTPWTTSLELTSAHDATAASGKPFVIPEVQTGPQTGFTRYGDEPGAIFDYNRIHLLAWQMAAHDAKAMYFWQWRPHMDEWQAFGRGLAASDGSITPRAVAAGDAARALNSDSDLFLDSKPLAPQVAVVYDVVGDLKAVAQRGDWGSYTTRNMIGIYRALWKDQVRLNILDGRQVTADSLKPYKLVIFPFYLCLRKNVAEAIETYVAGGGTVLADARFGIINELDRGYKVNPGLGMEKVFGARRHDLVASHNAYEVRITDPAGLLNGVTLPNHLVGRVFREELQLEKGSEGEVVAVFEKTGTPAVVVRRTGKGQTILLAFSLGIPLLENQDPGAAALLQAICKSAGVKPPIRLTTAPNAGPVEAVVHSRGREDERLVYVLNWGHAQANVTAELPWPGQARLQGEDMVSGRAVEVEHRENRAVFTLSLPADHAAAVHLQP